MAINVSADPILTDVTLPGAIKWYFMDDADPIEVTALPVGTFLEGLVLGDAVPVTITLRGLMTHSPPAPVNPDLNSTFNCLTADSAGVEGRGVVKLTTTLIGTWLNTHIGLDDEALIPFTVTVHGNLVAGRMLNDDDALLELSVDLGVTEAQWIAVNTGDGTILGPTFIVSGVKESWVKWSNIGELDFTIWKDNVAGERPLDFRGWVYQLKKLGNKVVAYGENGVSFLIPAGNAYGLQTVLRIGILGRHAVVGNESEHFFIDREGSLWRISDKLDKIGYSEYLGALTSPVMSQDIDTGMIYICDGVTGYVFNPSDMSLGEAPGNITGVARLAGNRYIGAAATITTPAFEICTDIWDFGTRHHKTIRHIELGTDMTGTLSVALDYRRSKAESFLTTPYRVVNKHGVAYITCFGQEFRVRVKQSAYESFEIDYITIGGEVHDY